jgi:hypothetical protein
MTFRPARTLGVIALLAMTISWATPGASSASPATGDRSAYAPAAIAVTAVTTQAADSAAAAIPSDFERVMGYRPHVRHGLFVDPGGSCSSPVPLPEGFEPACAEHDLGYDLLRYAALTGHPLETWARTAVDDRLAQRMRAVCAQRDSAWDRALCSTAAHVAATTVEINSLRQLRGVPEETLASWTLTVTTLATMGVVLGAGLAGSRRRRRDRRPAARPPARLSVVA